MDKTIYNSKQKAIELYNKFRNVTSVLTGNVWAKKQAILCVEEIISTLQNLPKWNSIEEEISFYESVKTELNKL